MKNNSHLSFAEQDFCQKTVRTQDLITDETKSDRFLKSVRFERSNFGSYKILSPYVVL